MGNTRRNYFKVSVGFILLINCVLIGNRGVAQQLYPASFDVTTLNGANGFRIPGIDPESQFGAETKFIGDINNDGFEDIALGVNNADVNGVNLAGAAYIIFGSDTELLASFDITPLDGTNGFVIEGRNDESRRMGSSVEGVGDVNGDGIDDLAITASRVTFVIYGKTTPFTPTLDIDYVNAGTNGFKMNFFLFSSNEVSKLGDVNGDNIDDFITANSIGGSAAIVFGRSSNFPAEINLSYLDGINGFTTSGYPSSRAAYFVGGAGDINNDGFNDIIIGEWSSSGGLSSGGQRTRVLFGRSTFSASEDLEALDGTNGFTVDNSGGGLLIFVGSLGDINNDGIDDFYSEQSAIFGKQSSDPFPAHIPRSSIEDNSLGFRLPGFLTSSSIGDINQDGINDFIALYGSSGSGHAAYVVFGSTTGFPNYIDQSVLDGRNGFVIPEFNTSNIGRPVSGGGDFNGDGIVDFIVGSPRETPEGSTNRTGEAYVVFGGDHYALPLNTGYPRVIDETISGFTLEVNGPEIGTIHYAIYPGNFSGTLDYENILNGTGATQNGNFLMSTANTDISEIITSLTIDTTYDVYLFLEDNVGNQGEIYHMNDVTTLSSTDTENPTASNPSPIDVQCVTNVPLPDPLVVTDEADNSGVAPVVAFVSDVSDGNSNPEIITRTYSITDEAGNSINVTQTITINDTEAPRANNPSGITVSCLSDIPPADINVVIDETDNCSTNPIVAFISDVSDGNSNPEIITRTYSITDEAGNSINVTQTITVNDTTDPIIDCPINITQNVDSGLSTTVVTYSFPTDADNCEVSSVVQITGLSSGSEFPIGTTTNTFEVTDSAGNSRRCSFDVVIIDTSPITCEIDAGEDEQITEGEEIQLNATTTYSGIYTWRPSIGLSSSNIVNPIANPVETTTYTIIFTSDDGCTTEDMVTIFVTPLQKDKTKYGFSPDGDGINEFWEIDAIENYPNNKVSIFNRWGDLVFEIEGYNNTSRVFTGIANRKRGIGGDQLPEGTYFFRIKIEGAHRKKKIDGFVVLKR
ncbi:gliding motility-associated C-terminal domain-containing protein [Aquimarina aquimarini]|uniref:T9SS type B sorting domain-containing protein n=1 Tax=Aquimarina aquimarini TaxID=1191734 RepID=UPI000D54EA19|nr:gliding motility-associated C-terminal domain-containing protein [Aquimarina aquimarini]